MKQKIKKLILPVAGLGARLRPLTYTTPKNLLMLGGKPLIAHALDEAVAAGVEEVILVVGREHEEQYGKFIDRAEKVYPYFSFQLVVQDRALGTGHAILLCDNILRDDPALVRFCDDVIVSNSPILSSLSDLYASSNSPILLLERVAPEEVFRYGVVSAENMEDSKLLYKIENIIEKPKVEEAPSNLIVVGGHVITGKIMARLREMSLKMEDKFDSLVLTNAFAAEAISGGEVYGWEYRGRRLDCGTLDSYTDAQKVFQNRPADQAWISRFW